MFRHELNSLSGPMSVWCGSLESCDLLLIHSLGSSGQTFEEMREHLPGLDCWAPDLWAHGDTPGRPSVSVDQMADDIASILPVGSRPAVMGVSFGGIIAQVLASRHPQSVSALLLSNTVSRWDGGEARLQRQEQAVRVAPSSESWRRERCVLVSDASPRSFDSYFFATERCTSEDFLRTARAAYMTDTTPYWPRIECPVFVITGERESRIPADVTGHLAVISGTDVVHVVPGADHLCHLDRPKETATVVRKTLSTCGVLSAEARGVS